MNQREHIKQELENIYQQSERLTPNSMKQQTTAGNSTMTSTGQKNKILGNELNTTTRKIKETIHSIKTENCISGISYKLPDIWLPALKVKHDGKTQTENNRQNSPNIVHLGPQFQKPAETSLCVRIGPNSTHIYDFTLQNMCPKMREVSVETSPV